MKKEVASELVSKPQGAFFTLNTLHRFWKIENPKISALSAKSIESPLVKQVDALLIQDPSLQKRLSLGSNFSIPLLHENNGYIANFHPIYDTSNKLAAYAVTYGYLDELVTIEDKYFALYCFGFIALLLLSVALFLLLQQRKNTLHDKMQLEAIFTKTLNGVLLLDRFGIIIRANKAALTMLEYTQTELCGKNSHALIHIHDETNENFECPILGVIPHQCLHG